MGMSSKESEKTRTNSSIALSSSGGNRECPDRIDSGFESARTDPTAKFSKGGVVMPHFNPGKIHDNVESVPGFETEAPWEVFLTGRKLTVAIYCRRPVGKEVPTTKPSLPGRSKPVLIKPVLRAELVHPALIVNTHSSGPRIQVSCFDVGVAGASPTRGKHKH